MDFQELINDRSVKPKETTEALSKWILNNPDKMDNLIGFAGKARDPIKGTCIEAFEFATRSNPDIATSALLDFVSHTLSGNAPRVKWESAKVVGNIAHLFPDKLDEAIKNLLVNTEDSGTVVRWSAALALGQIAKMKTSRNEELIPALESICQREEKSSIQKIYQDAFKKIKS